MTANDDRARIDRFRVLLETELAEALSARETAAQARGTVDLDQQSVGRLSRVDAMQAQQMALAADRQRQEKIARIRRALNQIENGTYGYCAVCDNPIADRRLEADPSAHLCVACALERGR